MYLPPSELSNSELKSLGIDNSEGFSTFTVEAIRNNPFDIRYEDAMVECFRGNYSTVRTPGAAKLSEWHRKALIRIGIEALPGIYSGGLIHLKLKDQIELDLVNFKLFIDAAADRLATKEHAHLENLSNQINVLNKLLIQGIANGSVQIMSNAIDERDHLLSQIASMVLTEDFIEYLVDPIAFMEIFGRTIGKYVFGYIQENPQVYCDNDYQSYIEELSFDSLVHYQEPENQMPLINLESIQEFTHRRYI